MLRSITPPQFTDYGNTDGKKPLLQFRSGGELFKTRCFVSFFCRDLIFNRRFFVWLIVKGSQLKVNTSPGTSVTFDG